MSEHVPPTEWGVNDEEGDEDEKIGFLQLMGGIAVFALTVVVVGLVAVVWLMNKAFPYITAFMININLF